MDRIDAAPAPWSHPLWLVGFRPFFLLAFFSGALLPLIWGGIFAGWIPASALGLPPLQWHAHEMLFGFGWAVMAGFLLTASKNWLKLRGLHGGPLVLAVTLWLIERALAAGLIPSSVLPIGVRYLLMSGSVLFVATYITYCLVRYRSQDTFRDNFFFIGALPLFIAGKSMILSEAWYTYGWSLSLGLFRVAFVVMFERTLTQFMKNSEGLQLLRDPRLDLTIKALVFASAFHLWMPDPIGATVLLLAALFLAIRFMAWRPDIGFRKFGNAVMYIGYAGLTTHLFLEGLVRATSLNLGTLPVHVFTFLCMGVVIPAMMIRICQGHTGRPLLFTVSDRVAIGAMLAASFFRLIAIDLWPEHYSYWIVAAALGWLLCFLLVGVRLTPFLLQARVDGKIH